MNKNINLEEEKIILHDLLRYVAKICESNNIKYSLCGGTLLGAVRHQGIIPWDDDIDIMLLRSEYDKLKSALKKDKRYSIIYDTDEGSHYGHLKICDKRTQMSYKSIREKELDELGVFIDIFPMDTVPDNKIDTEDFFESIKFLRKSMINSINGGYYDSPIWYKRCAKRILRFKEYRETVKKGFTSNFWKNEMLDQMVKYNDTEYNHVGNLMSQYGPKEVFPKSIFNSYTNLDFDGYNFQVISQYDLYLTILYGDYMELPKMKNRIVKHSYYRPIWK